MLDLIIRGGDVVTPQGVAQVRCRHQGRDHRRGRGAGHAGRQRCGARHRRGGQDRHARRHRSARAHAHPFMIAGRHDPLHARARPGRHGGALRRHHHADRFRLRDGRPQRAQGDRGARRGVRAQELLRLGLPPDARRASRRTRRSASWPRRSRPAIRPSRSSPPTSGRTAPGGWSTSATSGRCSRCSPRRAGSASSTPRTTTSSCTCTPS